MTGDVLSAAEYGDPVGAPIVALHGGRCTKKYWERTATEGIPQRRWICLDLRGHGDSVKSPPWTLAQLAEDVIATLDSLHATEVDVIGASLGGAVAFAVTRLAPSRVRSLVLVDPPVSTPDEYLSRPPFHAVQEADTIDEFLEPRISRLTPETQTWAKHEVQAMVERTESGHLRLRVKPETITALKRDISTNLPPRLGTFSGQALLLVSGISRLVTETGKQVLLSQLGNRLRVATFDDAGHNLLWDAFEGSVSEIARFLDDVDQSRRATSATDLLSDTRMSSVGDPRVRQRPPGKPSAAKQSGRGVLGGELI